MSNFTGYNHSKIEDLGKDIAQTITKNVADTITKNINDSIIKPLSEAWFTPEGQTYVKEFAEVVKKSEVVIQEVFQAFLGGIKTAADNWAENVGSKKRVNLKKAQRHTMKISSNLMKDNNNGNVGIMNTQAEKIANDVVNVRTNINTEIKNISNRLNAESAFLGAGQAASVETCFTKIHDEVAKIFSFLDEDKDGQSLKTAIKAAVTKYGDVGSSTATYFNSGQ